MGEQKDADLDWELSQDYYQGDDTTKEWKLEDFMEDENPEPASPVSTQETELLQKTIQDVRQVMKLASENNPIPEIARTLNLDEQYVFNIQITAQGFHEDDEIAVAHLILMG